MEKFKKYRLEAVVGIAILLLAFFLRFYNLTILPIFADEAIYIRWAQVMKAESTLRFLPLSDGKQPFFMWSVIPFLKIISDPLIAGRVTSVAAGIVALIGVFLLTKRLFGTRPALFTSLFYAASPFSVFFDRIGLVDSMLAMFGIWALYFGVLTAQTLRLDFAMLTGFALGFAHLTKSPAMFFFLMLPSTILFVHFPKEKLHKALTLIRIFSLWLVSWIIGFAMYNILRLGPNFHMLGLRNQDYVFSLQEVFKHPMDPFQFHIKEIAEWLFSLGPWTVAVLALAGIIWSWKKYWREIIVLGVWVLLPLLVQAEFAKVFTSRYILFTIPPIFVLGGLGMLAVSKRWRKLFLPILLVSLVVPIYFDWLLLTNPPAAPLSRDMRRGHLEEWTAGTGIREVASFIKDEQKKNPNEKIVIGTEGFFGTLPDGLQIYFDKDTNVIIKGVGLSINYIHESLIDAKKAGNRVFLVVNASRFEATPGNLGLVLLNSYPKAEKPDGTRDSLLFFEVTQKALESYDIKNPKTN